jgi:hypothetical protein
VFGLAAVIYPDVIQKAPITNAERHAIDWPDLRIRR